MGSGSYGGGGGGGSGGGGGGGGGGTGSGRGSGAGAKGKAKGGALTGGDSKNGSVFGPVIFDEGWQIDDPVDPRHVDDAVWEILHYIPRDYLEKQFCNPLIRSVYEQLFRLSVEIFQNKSWHGVSRHYGVPDGPGCLVRWSRAVLDNFRQTEPNRKAQEIAQMCLEDFLILALDDDPDPFVDGSSEKILSKLNQRIFNSTSGYFLGLLIWHVLRREKERVPEATETRLRQASQARADRIIASFESKFRHKDQTTYRDLFRIICENLDWFMTELRKKYEPQKVS